MSVLSGTGVSGGIAVGNAVCVDIDEVHVEHVHIPEERVQDEIARIEAAVAQAEAEIDELYANLARVGTGRGVHMGLLEAQKMMLRDPLLYGEAERAVVHQRINAEWAIAQAEKRLADVFVRMEDPFFRERGADIHHIGQLLIRCLSGSRHSHPTHGIAPGVIAVAKALTPGDALALARQDIGGFVLDAGTAASHTAIIARSLGIPAVVGIGDATGQIGDGDPVIVDGDAGQVIVQPSAAQNRSYSKRARRLKTIGATLAKNRTLGAVTRDGHAITLRCNLDIASDLERVLTLGGRGIGLFRSEFLYLDRNALPTEQEQLAIYEQVLRRAAPEPVTIRTLDVGGDKVLPAERIGVAMSPGLRAIRFCLQSPDVFETQLRALYRASTAGNLRLLVPFVSGLSEVRQTVDIMRGVRQQLVAEGHSIDTTVPIGFMIEVPSAALLADLIAAEASFLSVGTNDLIQYTLAISREDPATEYLYRPLHPAVLRLLAGVAKAAQAAGIKATVCGEMAGDPANALILAAMGFDELSMTGSRVPLVKEVIRNSDLSDARNLLSRVMTLTEADAVEDLVDTYMVEHFPGLLHAI